VRLAEDEEADRAPEADNGDLAEGTAAGSEDGVDEWVQIGGDTSLTMQDADPIAAQYGATLVLIAGEQESGKTTLLVELYGRFLLGPFSGLRFAGSETLDAFDARHFEVRYDSGKLAATTSRTQEEDMRVLHLRLSDGVRQRVLLPSDIRGEFFEHIVNGQPVAQEVAVASRADKTMVLVDGEQVADLSTRHLATRNARLLIGGLTDAGGLQSRRPMAIVLTKADKLAAEPLRWYHDHVHELEDWARERGADPVCSFDIAARPEDDPGRPRNLDEMLMWMWETSSRQTEKHSSGGQAGDRIFWDTDLVRNQR